jgi:NAD(P)-dependent dehydrogenase (short-subunit alcohol dehydrogenase family)
LFEGANEDADVLTVSVTAFGSALDEPVVNMFEGANEDTGALDALVSTSGSALDGAVENLFDDVGAEMQPAGV